MFYLNPEAPFYTKLNDFFAFLPFPTYAESTCGSKLKTMGVPSAICELGVGVCGVFELIMLFLLYFVDSLLFMVLKSYSLFLSHSC